MNLYSSQGDPIRTFRLPPLVEWSFPRIAYNGNRLVVVDGKTIARFDATGKVIGQFPALLDEAPWWTPFLDREGRKRSLFDGERTIRSFELPR